MTLDSPAEFLMVYFSKLVSRLLRQHEFLLAQLLRFNRTGFFYFSPSIFSGCLHGGGKGGLVQAAGFCIDVRALMGP